MIREKQQQTGPIIIDLTGPQGNAFFLLGYAKKLAKQLEIDYNWTCLLLFFSNHGLRIRS